MCRSKIEVPKKHLFMLRFYAKRLKRHLEEVALELIGSESIREQLQAFLDELISDIDGDIAVSVTDDGTDDGESPEPMSPFSLDQSGKGEHLPAEQPNH